MLPLDNKEIFFGDSYAPTWGSSSGVRRAHAEETIRHPTRHQTFDLEGLRVDVHARRIDDVRVPYTTLVVTCIKPNEPRVIVVYTAVKVYDDLREGVEALQPLDMLRVFAEEMGIPVDAGGVELHFRVGVKIPVPVGKETNLFGIRQRPTGNVTVVSLFKIDKAGDQASIALLFAVDLSRYEAWLHQH